MPNPYGWGQNEPQIKPKDQGGDTIATFSQKIYNLFDNLFNTLNSYPWSTATQNDAGYMSAADKTALDDVPTTYLPLAGGAMSGAIINNSMLAIRKPDRTGLLTLVGGDADNATAGGKLYLYGSSSPKRPGFFGLQAGDANGYKQLFGAPDGTLTWGGSDIFTVGNCPIASSVGSDPYTYKAKFANGVMIQATYDIFTTDEYSRFDWVFPEAFLEFPFVSVLKVSASRSYNLYSCTKTLARIRVNDMSGASVGSDTAHVMMIAVGRCK